MVKGVTFTSPWCLNWYFEKVFKLYELLLFEFGCKLYFTFSGDVQLVESVLVTFALIFSRSQLLYDQKLFHETFTFLSMLLDQDMASKNGKMVMIFGDCRTIYDLLVYKVL